MDIEKIISTLNKRLKTLFTYHVEIKKSKNNFNYLSESNYMCSALTRGEEVKVINLFDNYWIYIHINISPSQEAKKVFYFINFSLSVFYGSYGDLNKQQLFRAEWDNYEKPCSLIHPQPHWHFYIDNEDIDISKDFNDNIENNVNNGFMEMISNSKIQNNLFKEMHFAMSERWITGKGEHIHKINDTNDFIEWVLGLIDHINGQLKYIDGSTTC